MKALISILCCVAISGNINVHAQDEKKEVLAISQQFFSALEKGDTAALRSLFLDDALNYFVQERDTKVRTGSRSPKSFKADKDRVVRSVSLRMA